jgi:MATE family multidrug resistance protein
MTGVSLVNMGMALTDTVMMGWLGPTALAAGAVVSDLYSLVFYLAAGTLSIIATFTAQAVGAGDPDGVRRAARSGFATAFLLLVPAFVLVWWSADFVRLLGVESAIPDLGRGYAHAMAFTIVPMLFVAVWRSLFGALGRPRIFLVATLAALPLNALANLVLMFGWGPVPALGITGAGLGSALIAAALLAGVTAFSVIDHYLGELRLFEAPWRVSMEDIREVFRLGLPIGVFTLGEVGLFLVATVVVSLFGTEALAAHAIALRMAGIVYAIPSGVSQAATVRVGNAIGAAEAGGLRRAMSTAMTVGAASGLAICLALTAGSSVIPGLFVESGTGLSAAAATLLLVLGLFHLAQGVAGPSTAILRAFKDTRVPMQLSLAGFWIVGMPVGAVLGFGLDLGVLGIWCGLGAGVLTSAVLLTFRFVQQVPGHSTALPGSLPRRAEANPAHAQ